MKQKDKTPTGTRIFLAPDHASIMMWTRNKSRMRCQSTVGVVLLKVMFHFREYTFNLTSGEAFSLLILA